MKKNKLLVTSIVTGMLFTPFADTNVYAADSSNAANSNAEVEFTLPEDAVAPQLPDGSGKPNPDAGITGNVTGKTGPLTLDYVSNLEFGTHTLETVKKEYNATTKQPYIQISDRRGSGEGWHVTAQLSRFTQGDTPTLSGAKIDLKNGIASSKSGNEAPIPEENVVLNSGGSAVNVVNAAAKAGEVPTAQGLGTWTNSWLATQDTNENVILTVPNGAASSGKHTATITWTLVAGPTK